MNKLPLTKAIQFAFQKQNRLAMVVGALLGFVVPLLVFTLSHKIPTMNYLECKFWVFSFVCAGGCFFSAKSVYQCACMTFQQDKVKAIGFAALLEGMLIISGIDPDMAWMGRVALGYLMGINALFAGVSLACEARSFNMDNQAITKRKRSKKRAVAI